MRHSIRTYHLWDMLTPTTGGFRLSTRTRPQKTNSAFALRIEFAGMIENSSELKFFR
jgi:hypothetical protein